MFNCFKPLLPLVIVYPYPLFVADRAKSIRNVASVNVSNTDEMIQGLLREKEQLLEELKNAKAMKSLYSEEGNLNNFKYV